MQPVWKERGKNNLQDSRMDNETYLSWGVSFSDSSDEESSYGRPTKKRKYEKVIKKYDVSAALQTHICGIQENRNCNDGKVAWLHQSL